MSTFGPSCLSKLAQKGSFHEAMNALINYMQSVVMLNSSALHSLVIKVCTILHGPLQIW